MDIERIERRCLQKRKRGSPADKAREILEESPYHPLRRLTCSYSQGVLTVVGCLPSFHLKQLAQTALRDLDGVTRIENQIEVRPKC